MFLRRLWLAVLLVISLAKIADCKSLDSLFESFISNFGFLPEYYLQSDLSTFAFHKNEFFKRQYLAESNLGVEFMFLSFRKLLYSVWDINFRINLGEVPGNVVFTVLNISFSIAPILEFRHNYFNTQIGLEHYCVHDVDRKDYSIVYWNNLFAAIGSKNMRINEFWILLSEEGGWTFRNRFSWYFRWGYFLKEFFGLVGTNKLNGSNANAHEFQFNSRFAFYRRRSWIITAYGQTWIGQYDKVNGLTDRSGVYWRQDTGIESYFRRGKRGASFYIKFILDGLPITNGVARFSKDRLLEIGISFFN